MKPVYQTKFSPNGNCWRAVIASILAIEIDSMPHFEEIPHRLLIDTRIWLAGTGLALERYSSDLVPRGYAIAVGTSPRNLAVDHAIVVKEGKFAHDPFPGSKNCVVLLNVKEYFKIQAVKGAHRT
jgi:hypothetical protein